MRQQRGFTILEVIIVVTIAGFLLAAALPSASAWIRNTRIRTAAESISVGLQQARSEAVRRNQPVSFYLIADPTGAVAMTNACALSSASSGWVVDTLSPAGRCGTDFEKFIAARVAGEASSGLTVSAVDSGGTAATTVSFNGFGQVANALPISCIQVRTSDATARALNIAVNVGGQVRMCDPAVTDANDPRICQAGCP